MAVADHKKQEALRQGLFDAGVLIFFRGRWFVNSALTEDDVTRTLEMTDSVMKTLK
ncbi:MAG: hypothetical protein AB9907_01120 [Flexilinea sp.]